MAAHADFGSASSIVDVLPLMSAPLGEALLSGYHRRHHEAAAAAADCRGVAMDSKRGGVAGAGVPVKKHDVRTNSGRHPATRGNLLARLGLLRKMLR